MSQLLADGAGAYKTSFYFPNTFNMQESDIHIVTDFFPAEYECQNCFLPITSISPEIYAKYV